jgi:hypothetical protein
MTTSCRLNLGGSNIAKACRCTAARLQKLAIVKLPRLVFGFERPAKLLSCLPDVSVDREGEAKRSHGTLVTQSTLSSQSREWGRTNACSTARLHPPPHPLETPCGHSAGRLRK